MNIRNLKKPPIAEALILIVPKLEAEASHEQLVEIKDKLSKQYPNVTEKKLNSLSFSIEEDGAKLNQSEKINGFEVSNTDRSVVIQIDPDKLIISRLPPYKDGDELVELCNDVAKIYCEILNSQKINHIALRYINNMKVWSNELDEMIKIQVSINCDSNALQAHKIASRFHVNSPENDAGGVVNYVLDVPDEAEEDKERGVLLDVILDIDVYRRDVPVPENFEGELQKLRDFKNVIFFKNVDEKLLQEFDR